MVLSNVSILYFYPLKMLGNDKAVAQHDLSNSNSVYGASLIHPTC